MNPLAKALGTVLVLAAGTLGSTLDHGVLPDFLGGLPMHRSSEGAAGNETGNQTSDGNETGDAGGNETAGGGNQTAGDDGADGNETGDAGGNETAGDGNETAGDGGADGNETDDGDDDSETEDTSVCDFSVDEWGDDLTPSHHEWEWLVTKDVTSLDVEFYSYGGVPISLGDHATAALIDGAGRTLARTGSDGSIHVALERGTDYMASGSWRLVFDSSDALSDYYAGVALGCDGE